MLRDMLMTRKIILLRRNIIGTRLVVCLSVLTALLVYHVDVLLTAVIE